jgi:hypothetical protein
MSIIKTSIYLGASIMFLNSSIFYAFNLDDKLHENKSESKKTKIKQKKIVQKDNKYNDDYLKKCWDNAVDFYKTKPKNNQVKQPFMVPEKIVVI